ncbi:MAG: AAA family ATPase [bacterium]|jgi:twinkle protein
MRLIPDTMDFSLFERDEELRQLVKPMGQWRDEVVQMLLCPPAQRGKVLPWSKADSLFRLRPSELTIWAGENRAGKSALLNMVTMALAAQGEKVLIVSLEMKPTDTIDRALRQFARTYEPTARHVDALLTWAEDRVWLYDYVGSMTLAKLMPAMRWAVAELGVTHIVIDSLMRLGTGETDYDAQKQAIDQLCSFKHDTGAHIHLVAHSRKPANAANRGETSRYDVKGTGTISDLADNVVVVVRNEAKERKAAAGEDVSEDEPDTLLVIDKQRHGSAWTGALKLWYVGYCQQWIEKPTVKGGCLVDLANVGAPMRVPA